MLDGVANGSLNLVGVSNRLYVCHLFQQQGGLLFLLNFGGQEGLYLLVVPGQITLFVNTGEDDYQHVVVVAAFIKGRNITDVGVFVKDPTQSLAGAAYVGYIVFGAAHAVAGLYGITGSLGIGFNVFGLGVSGQEGAEIVVCLAVSVLAEVVGALDNGGVVLADKVLAVSYLGNDNTLSVQYNLVV